MPGTSFDSDISTTLPRNIDHAALLAAVLQKLFPRPEHREAVIGILGTYGREAFHREAPRVHLRILKLAGSDVESVKQWISPACLDWRDLLVEAEYWYSFGNAN